MIYLLGFNYKLFSELKYTTILQVAAGKQKLKPVFEQVDQIVQFCKVLGDKFSYKNSPNINRRLWTIL